MMSSAISAAQLILLVISQQAVSRPADSSDDGAETQPDNYILSFGGDLPGDLASRAAGHESATIISASTFDAGSKPPSQSKPGIAPGQGNPAASLTGQSNPTWTQSPSPTTPGSGSSQPNPPGSAQTFSQFLSSFLGSSGMGSEGSNQPFPSASGGPQFGWSTTGSSGALGSQRPNRPPPFASGGSQFGSSSLGGSGAMGSQISNRPPPFSSGGPQYGQSSSGSSSSSGMFPGYMTGFMQSSQSGNMNGNTPPPPPPMMSGGPFGGSGNPFGGPGSPFGSDGGFTTQSGPAMLFQQGSPGNNFALPSWLASLMNSVETSQTGMTST